MMTDLAVKRTVIRNGRTYHVMDHHQPGEWDFWGAFADHWEPELDGLLAEHLTGDGVFVDVGAWVGPVTLIAARLCGHVHAVEPDPVARGFLEGNVARMRRQNVSVYPVAVAAQDGTVRIGHRSDRAFGDSMTSAIFREDAIEVPAVSMQTVTADLDNICLLKMDIEGGEEAVLPAASEVLHRLGAPLLLSTHAAIVDDPGRYRRALDAALDGWDTTVVSGSLDGLATILAVPR